MPETGCSRLATGMLITMLGVLVLANVFLSVHPSVGYLRAFAEAAVVGAMADWFAVTALFRQPLGLPIPHTAIVPRNKDRIGEALGRFVELNFASPEVVSSKLAGADMSGKLARWLSDPQRTEAIAAHVTRLIPQLLDSVDDRRCAPFCIRRPCARGTAHRSWAPARGSGCHAYSGEAAPGIARQVVTRS